MAPVALAYSWGLGGHELVMITTITLLTMLTLYASTMAVTIYVVRS